MSGNGMAFFPTNFMLQSPSTEQEDHHHHHHQQHPHHHHHNPHHHHHHHQQPPSSTTSLNPNILPPCQPQDFHGVASFLGKRSVSFSGIELGNNEEGLNGGGEDELSDDGSQAGEKKRRLNMEQVKTLEKNFELGNKLEPERKMQLARALGLQPRQIAIWFQNRRARWKTKQLEKDYDLLKRQFEAIKADNDALQSHNQKLQAEILALKNREPTESINLNKETEGSCSNRSENSSDIKLDISRTPAIDSPLSNHHPITSRSLFPTTNSNSNNNNNNNNNNTTTNNTNNNNNNNGLIRPGSSVAQLFQNTPSSAARSSSDHPHPHPHSHHLQFHKGGNVTANDHHHHHHQGNNSNGTTTHVVKEESLSNMFCGIEDQSGFWPWLEQNNFN